jgi:hypothetical protein
MAKAVVVKKITAAPLRRINARATIILLKKNLKQALR